MEDGVAIFLVVGAALERGECEMTGVEVEEQVEAEVGAARAQPWVLSLIRVDQCLAMMGTDNVNNNWADQTPNVENNSLRDGTKAMVLNL